MYRNMYYIILMIPLSIRIKIITLLNDLYETKLAKATIIEAEKYNSLIKCEFSFKIIFSKLETNQFKSLNDLLNAFKTYQNEILNIVSKDSTIGFAILDLFNKIFSILNQFQQNKEKDDKEKTDLQSVISKLENIIPSLPNSSVEVKQKMNFGQRDQSISEPIFPEVENYPTPKREDIQLINDYIHRVKTDDEALDIINIVKIFNPEAVNNNRISIYTNDLSPITITLLRQYFTSDD